MTILNEIPFIRILLPFLTGIIVYSTFHVETDLSFSVYGMLAVCLVSWMAMKKFNSSALKYFFGISIQLFLIFFGHQLSFARNEKNSTTHYTAFDRMPEAMYARIVSIPVRTKKSIKAELEIDYAIAGSAVNRTNGKVIAYFADTSSTLLAFGKTIILKSRLNEIEEAKNPGTFDYKAFLKSKNIFHSVYVKRSEYKLVDGPDDFTLTGFAVSIKQKLLDILRSSGLKGQELAIASSLLLGYDDEVSKDLSEAYAITGTIHILSVSGMHIGIIYMMLNFSLGFLDKRRRGLLIKGIIVLMGVWLFAMISGLSPSVVRAAVMFSLFIIGSTFKLQTNVYNTLLASAFLILLYDPFLVSDIGFQLSYLALAGILFFQPRIYSWFEFEHKYADKTWALCSVSVAAQLTTFPVTLFYFHSVSFSFLIANLIIIPISTFIMYGAILVLITSSIPVISGFFASAVALLVKTMNSSALLLSGIPGSHLSGLNVTLPELILIYMIVIFVTAYFIQERKKHLFIALGMTAALLLSFNISVYNAVTENDELIVYHDREKSCIDLFSGRNVLSIGDEIAAAREYRLVKNVSAVIHVPLRDELVYSVNGYTFSTLKNTKNRAGDFPQLLLLRDNPRVNFSKLAELYPGSIIVSDGTNRLSKQLKWKSAADSLNLKFWSTAGNGAFIRKKSASNPGN